MKQLIIIGLLLTGISAGAQFVIDKGTESRHIGDARMTDATYIGSLEDQTLWVSHARNGWQITGADHGMEPIRTQGLKTAADQLLAATLSGDTVTLVLADASRRQRTDLLIARCTPAGEWTVDTLQTLHHGKKDRCLLWGAVSPSRNRMAVCSIVEYTETRQYSAHITMLLADGGLDFRHEYPLGTMDQLYATDDGRIATLGTEQDGKTLHIIVNYADRGHAETNEVLVTCEPPRELKIANILGNHLVALGTVSGSGFHGAEAFCGGTLAFAYDLAEARMAGFTIRPFQNEDINILYNKPTRKAQRDLLCEHATPLAYTALPYGAAMVLGRNYEKISLADNGTEEHSFSRVGLHVVAADTAARILWVRNLRRNDFQKGSPDLLNVGVATIDSTLCIVKSESRKMPTAYEIGKEAKMLKMGEKSNLVLYSIAADGTVNKDVLEAKSKHSLLHLTPRCDIVTVRGSRVRHIKLSRQ